MMIIASTSSSPTKIHSAIALDELQSPRFTNVSNVKNEVSQHMLVGYARVSTQDQHLALQIDALHKAGCERIFEDKISGSKTDRVGLANAISHLRKDDTLVVWKLDRLGRSVKDLVHLITQLEGQGVHFKSLTDVIDTSTPSGRFFFHVMASLSQMERELTIERTQAGWDVLGGVGD